MATTLTLMFDDPEWQAFLTMSVPTRHDAETVLSQPPLAHRSTVEIAELAPV